MAEEWLPPQEIVHLEFNSLRGRLFSAIESLGLPEKQERAVITMIRHLSYQNQQTVLDLVGVLDERGANFKYREGRLVRA